MNYKEAVRLNKVLPTIQPLTKVNNLRKINGVKGIFKTLNNNRTKCF